jgi:hypothetical protein
VLDDRHIVGLARLRPTELDDMRHLLIALQQLRRVAIAANSALRAASYVASLSAPLIG